LRNLRFGALRIPNELRVLRPQDTSLKVALATKSNKSFPAALILAGGLGERLRSAYSAGPKSLAPVGRRPFLDYLLGWLRGEGVQEIILCVGYKRSLIQRYVGSGRKWGLRVRYSIEKRLLGTAGAVKKGGEMLDGTSMFVINGDTFLDVNLREMNTFHRARKGWATLAVARVADAGRFGTLRLDAHGRVTTFLEKRVSGTNDACACPNWNINGGVYLFEKKLLKSIPTHGQVSLEKEVFPRLLLKKVLFGFVTDGYFLDIGVPNDFRRAQSELPERFRIYDSC
jgi:D-glycero-alpha-D-manno-heptose 1-phosphate guanylyltransferase